MLFLICLLSAPRPSFTAFNDLPNDPLYSPYIENFQAANIIVGDTAGGQPTGNLRPFDQIKRSEFTKITTLIRLLEEAEAQGTAEKYQGMDLDSFTLKINEALIDYYKPKPNTPDFKDVEDKDPACASNPEGCEPWYGQYVNYAASQGLLKGFPDGTFKPGDPILRIHALKLLMASNGEKLAYYDDRFIRLSSDPRLENVNVGKCLEGAEDFILKNNDGGDNLSTGNLLTYAMLADKLDFFGAHCEFFTRAGADTPEKRAALLQKPVTRQEIARYFALTTPYSALKIDHENDPTTSTKEENGMNFYDEEAKKKAEEKLKEEPEKALPLKEAEKEGVAQEKELIEANKEKAEVTIKELTAMTKEGRCCFAMNLDKNCEKIKFKDYTISEASSYNYETYQGGTWHEAKKNGNRCWIPLEDILGGFAEKGNIEPSDAVCGLTSSQTNLMSQYNARSYPRMVREIWTTGNSNELKMFMQIGLDFAAKKSIELEKMKKEKKPDCYEFKEKLKALNSGHLAASVRLLPTTDPKIKEVEKLLLSSPYALLSMNPV